MLGNVEAADYLFSVEDGPHKGVYLEAEALTAHMFTGFD